MADTRSTQQYGIGVELLQDDITSSNISNETHIASYSREPNYYYNVDTTSGDVNLNDFPAGITFGQGAKLPAGTEFTFFNNGDGAMTFTQNGVLINLASKGDAITLIYTDNGDYLIKSSTQSTAGEIRESITAFTDQQFIYSLSAAPKTPNTMIVYLAGLALHEGDGFNVNGNIVTLTPGNIHVEGGEIIRFYYTV